MCFEVLWEITKYSLRCRSRFEMWASGVKVGNILDEVKTLCLFLTPTHINTHTQTNKHTHIYIHTNTMRKHCSNVCKMRPCLAIESTNSARMRIIVTAALQRQYAQTELIFWINLVFIYILAVSYI